MEMVYVAANRSLAMAEVAVHFTLATLPNDYRMATLFIPDDIAIQKQDVFQLPPNWNTFPHPSNTQAIGDRFIADNGFCLLQVPSAVVQGDYNFLLNPNHTDFGRISIVSIEKFPFDKRIFQ